MYMYVNVTLHVSAANTAEQNNKNIIYPVAMIFRYNVLSLVYLLLFMASLVLPGPHLKTQKGEVHVHVHVHLSINGDKIETQISKFTIYEYIDTCDMHVSVSQSSFFRQSL